MLGLAGRSSRRPTFARSERRRAGDLLERLDLHGLADRQIGELSGGQLQRVLIARALITDPAIVLMDEPTSGLDLRRLRELLLLARELQLAGTTIVLTTHDLNWVAAQLPRVVFLDGTVVADGRPRDVITTDLIDDVYGAPAKVIRDRRGNVFVLAQLARDARPCPNRAAVVRRRPRRPSAEDPMRFLTEPFQFEFFVRALIAAVIVGVTCGAVGTHVTLRNMSAIGNGLSQCTLGGVAVAVVAGVHPLAGALAGALLASWLLTVVTRHRGDPPRQRDRPRVDEHVSPSASPSSAPTANRHPTSPISCSATSSPQLPPTSRSSASSAPSPSPGSRPLTRNSP